ncbi:MAG: LL-diaminopimelate aminotransferase, partial [Phototrophicales bacterium]
CDVTFDGYVAPSVLQVPGAKEQTVEFMSFSKSFNMAGWRLGAAVGSAEALKQLLKVKSNVDSGHFRSIYDAGIAAIDYTESEWFAERNQMYERRRDMLLEALPEIGLSAQPSIG